MATEIRSNNTQQTQQIGITLGQHLQSGDVIALSGDLGSGKTTFAVGVGQGWGARVALTSPTFVIVHQHQRVADGMRLYHLDTYRIETAADAHSLGLDDLFDEHAAFLIEWAEHIRAWLPDDYLWIHFAALPDDSRSLQLSAFGARAEALLQTLLEKHHAASG